MKGKGWDWVRAGLDSDLPPIPRLVFVALSSWASSESIAYRPLHRLMGDTGLSARSIQRALTSLTIGGWVKVIDMTYPDRYLISKGDRVVWPVRGKILTHGRLTAGSQSSVRPLSVDCESRTTPLRGCKKSPKSPKSPKTSIDIGQFSDFWALYPRKVKRQAALTRWSKLIASGVDPDVLLASVGHYGEHLARIGTEARYIPHCSTWLNSGQYVDHLEACTSACECLESRGGRRESIEEEAARIVAEYPELGLLSSSGGLIVHDGGRE